MNCSLIPKVMEVNKPSKREIELYLEKYHQSNLVHKYKREK